MINILKALWAWLQAAAKPPVVVVPAPEPAPTPVPEPAPIPEPTPIPPPPPPTPARLKIYDLAKSCLGKDIAATQDELGCAEAVSYVLRHVPGTQLTRSILGTSELNAWLKTHFVAVPEPLPGDVIISPTGTSAKGAAHGHTGIVGYYGIMSNNSLNGLWQQNYTTESWKAYYTTKLGFPVLFYRFNG